tara:strand:- start:45 stop:341 length:297 start_codon:yes stop_codon:yes gene_type:complete
MFTVHTTHINLDVGYADTRHTWERTLKITLLVLTFRLLVHYSIPAGLNYYWGRARWGYILRLGAERKRMGKSYARICEIIILVNTLFINVKKTFVTFK